MPAFRFVLAIAFGLPRIVAAQVTTLTPGTVTPGGGFPVYGDAFAEIVHAQDATLVIVPRNTAGSGENLPLLDAGKLDLALVARWRPRASRGPAIACASSPRSRPRPACSWCAATVPVEPLPI